MKSNIEFMNIRFLFLALVLIAGFSQPLKAQHTVVDPPRVCATMEQDSINRARYPQRGTLEEFERSIQQKIQEIRLRGATGRILAGVVTIPIIVHVVHNGEAIGTGTNISQAQIQSQIEVLNEDFRKKLGTPGYNSNPVGADIEIEFCLSPVDENGSTMTEPGIDRYDGNKDGWARSEIENQLKPTTYWDPNKFFNVWTLKFATADANLLGYAQFPDQSGLAGLPASGPASTDGVVIRYQSFGSTDKGTFPVMVAPYNKGRTMSHETGHWLGLRHIWGDGACADDFVADTPTAHTSNTGCPANKLSCDNVSFEMVQNYMDYTNDACMNIFTQGQKTRMQAVMELSPRRNTLIQANLCSPIAADVPTANFTSDKQLVLLGGDINFTDLSTNFPTEWNWTFEGGDPNTSTARNQRVTYTIPGTYKVTLVAKNSLGSSAPLELVDYITVSQEGLCSSTTNFEAGFTPSALPLSGFGNYTGYLTGHNSAKSKAISEYFQNSLGYAYINGVNIQFAHIYTTSEEASVTVTVWNARGPQNAPGSVIEQKVVLLKQIQADLDNNRPTTIVFDRETPVFSRPYQIGVTLNYSGDSVAVESSADGEAVQATSWIQNEAGTWQPYAIAFGANIALNISPFIGVNPSVQISASKQLIYPGEEVTLNGRGASIFVWNANDGSVEDYAGPQLIVRPTQTTTYFTKGSGLDLCYDSAYTTIYIRDNVLGVEDVSFASGISIYPNPGTTTFTVALDNEYIGDVSLQIQSAIGNEINKPITRRKETRLLQVHLETSQLQAGVYLVKINLGKQTVVKKWIKL